MGKSVPAAKLAARRRLQKAKQVSKLGEIYRALCTEGFDTLDQQAAVLGLKRSTTWALLHSDKRRGPSIVILKQLLSSLQIPSKVRKKVNEYIQAKSLGLYGHSQKSIRNLRRQIIETYSTSQRPQ
jgi:hypothetical protein